MFAYICLFHTLREPSCEKFKYKPLKHEEKLNILFLDNVAIGKHAFIPSVTGVPSELGCEEDDHNHDSSDVPGDQPSYPTVHSYEASSFARGGTSMKSTNTATTQRSKARGHGNSQVALESIGSYMEALQE